MLALYLLMMRTRFGQALRATIQHREAARLVGIDTDRVAGYGFGLGLATAAIGGTALALDSTIYPSLHWHWIGPLMAIIVVGGLGSVPGAAIAAMVLGMLLSLLQIPLGTTWAQTVFYVALFATLAFRPQGFFGGRLAQRF
jgi:branched-chain amino acid transport system permease protein